MKKMCSAILFNQLLFYSYSVYITESPVTKRTLPTKRPGLKSDHNSNTGPVSDQGVWDREGTIDTSTFVNCKSTFDFLIDNQQEKYKYFKSVEIKIFVEVYNKLAIKPSLLIFLCMILLTFSFKFFYYITFFRWISDSSSIIGQYSVSHQCNSSSPHPVLVMGLKKDYKEHSFSS